MTKPEDELEPIRDRIDAIDGELHKLLNERAACALKIGEIKQATPGEEPPVFYRPEREAQILARIQKENMGPLPDADIAGLFLEIIS